eukprot:5568935-Prymnesium_polylepis.1
MRSHTTARSARANTADAARTHILRGQRCDLHNRPPPRTPAGGTAPAAREAGAGAGGAGGQNALPQSHHGRARVG